MTDIALAPAMPVDLTPTWTEARWISGLDVGDLAEAGGRIALLDSDGFATARILLRDGLATIGFVEVPVSDHHIAVADLRRELAALPVPAPVPTVAFPPITVATTTRNRPENMAPLLTAILAQDYPEFDVIVVDNASTTRATVDAARAAGDDRVQVIREPLPGAARGRNAALLTARHNIVAFVDDDILPDRRWLQGIAVGFDRAADVGMVNGLVASGEMMTAAQGYFEARIDWQVSAEPRVFTLADPPADIPMFPFDVGYFGTGANWAMRRDYALAMGGLNEALGTGSPAGGGEDIDLFVRMLYAGHALVYEPTSLVWHRHRRDRDALEYQMRSYGRGFGAWITTVLLDPAMRRDALRLIPRGMGRAGAVGSSQPRFTELPGIDMDMLRRSEVLGMATGPWFYARSLLDHRSPRPLRRR